MSNKKEVNLEVGKFFSEELKVGLQTIYIRYHRVLLKDDNYKQRKVFLSEQFCLNVNGEISLNTKGEVEIERFSRKIFSEITEKEYLEKRDEMLFNLNNKLKTNNYENK
jgi:hypothetical protein|nr:MAG TPA: hypothetical protein [Caudoviricetes sp.]